MPAVAAKPARTLSIRLKGRVILIHANGRTDVYRVERKANDGPDIVLRWTKRQNGRTASEYTVAADGEYASCGCKGSQYGHVCRHVAASRVLLGRGLYTEVD